MPRTSGTPGWSRRLVAGVACGLVMAGATGRLRSAAAQAPGVAAPATIGLPPFGPADVHFMSGMIVHHAQAVLMAGWAPSHNAGPAVRTLCERIIVSQRDEIALMGRWLADRHQTVPTADGRAGLEMPGMGPAILMPGMLTAAQLAALDSARGAAFERLFLRFMIQHHEGALAMVQQLLNTPGAAQDGLVFQFAADVSADQMTEINRMRRMLATLPS